MFSSFIILEVLDLGNNKISIIVEIKKLNIPNLKEINLNNNTIENIQPLKM